MTSANESSTEQNSVSCSWVLTVEEFKTTQVLARRIHTDWTYLAFFACIPILGFAGMFMGKTKPNFHDSGFWTPVVVLILITLYVISQQLPIRTFCGTWNFRRGESYNVRVSQTVSQEGYVSDQGDLQILAKWSGLAKALETPQGFALFRPGKKKAFLWLPKHGFASTNDIDKCRALIRENLQDFRTLKS